VARTWAATIRAATQRNPRTLLPATMGLPGAEGRLAAGVVALLAGDLGVAAGLLREAADHPDADIGVVAPAACAGRVVRLLAGKDLDDPATDLEALMLDAEVGGWPWLSRIGRALLALDTPGTAPAVEPCDPWGAAVVTFVDGLGRRAAEPLRTAADRFTELGAPVPALWAACLATACRRAGRDDRARSAGRPPRRWTSAPRSRARTLGCGTCRPWSTPGRPGPRPRRPAPRVAARRPRTTRRRAASRSRCACSAAPRSRSTAWRWTSRPCARVRGRRCGCWRCARANAVHRDVLVASLWPDVDEEAALRSLQVAISSLRSVLGGRDPHPVDAAGAQRERLIACSSRPGSRSDRARLRRAARGRPHPAGTTATPRVSGRRWRRRSGTTGATCCPRKGAAEWVVAERDRLRIAAAGGWCALGRRLGDDGDFSEAVDAVRAGLRLDAYSDDGWRLLVDLHTRAGNPAAAQAAAMEHAQVLAELGVETEVRAPS
jgi:hypothetical protein